ncbi:MAG TPA: hypothetical protein VJM53_05215, partial [Burkholderiales bacterium]|nr:hypothetical protein [Burkholderiales bacterium]
VGIQTLTRAALPVKIRIISTQLSGVDREAAVLLPALRSSDELKLILRTGVYNAGQRYTVEGPIEREFLPTHVSERGPDYEVLVCSEAPAAHRLV